MRCRTLRQSSRCTGFTLIELLIVIVIILILVAIALPNFLEAQIRARVTNARADMRTLATALECYHTDYYRYPFQGAITPANNPSKVVIPVGYSGVYDPDDTGPGPKNGSPQNRYLKFVPSIITTPIPYLTDIPFDPFAQDLETGFTEAQYYFYNNLDDSVKWMLSDGGKTRDQIRNMLWKQQIWGSWTLLSGGPDRDNLDIAGSSVGLDLSLGYYSPTNGTKSNGDILWTQKNPIPRW